MYRNYRAWFALAVAGNIALAVALVLAVRRGEGSAPAGNPGVSPTTADAPDAPTSPASEQPVPVQITPQRMQMIGVTVGRAEAKSVHDEIRATGTVEVDEQKLAYVQIRFPGWIRGVYANATYQYLRQGQPLFTIYSPEVASTEQEYLLARQNRDSLQASSSTAKEQAQWLLDAADSRLEQWQVPAAEISRLKTTGKAEPEITVLSPASGYIVERNALPNMYVQPETKLYTVADLSTVWVMAQVYEDDLGKIRHGDSATVIVDAYPGRVFRGQVDFVYPQVDMSTRTARVRLAFSNPDLKLTPGMYVTVTLQAPLGRQLTTPATAVFHSGTRNLVFIDQGGGRFQPREVQLGARVDDDFIVLKGLRPGTAVATSANFLLDSESQLQAAAGAYTPPSPGAGGAAAMNAPATAQANLDLSTEPSPPHKGSNRFRVRLSTADGKAIDDAQVNVTFFMPAMPAMGMAAMRTSLELAGKGDGVYEGQGDLGSGGSWQVTLTARKNGQTIATKQITINAEGGM